MSGPNDTNAQAPAQTLVKVAFYTKGDPKDGGDIYGNYSQVYKERAATLASAGFVFEADSVAAATSKLAALSSTVTIVKVYFVGHGDDSGFWFNGDRDATGHFEDISLANPSAPTAYLENPSLGLTLDLFHITDNGATYTAAPTLSITGGGGTGARVSIDINKVMTVQNPGSGYTSAPTVNLVSPGKFSGGAAMTIACDAPPHLGSDFVHELGKHMGNDFQVIFVACHTGNALVGQVAKSLNGNGVAAGKVKGYTSWYATIPTGPKGAPVFKDELQSAPDVTIPGTQQINNNLPNNAPYSITSNVSK